MSASCRVQIATCVKDHTKYAVKIIKKADGKEALLLQLQSECSTPTSWFVSWSGTTRQLQLGHAAAAASHRFLQQSQTHGVLRTAKMERMLPHEGSRS